MKRKSIFLVFIHLFISIFVFETSFSQGSENFSNIPASSSTYTSNSWTGVNGSNWNATDSRTDQTITTKAITIRNGALTFGVSSSQADLGIGSLTLTAKSPFSSDIGTLQLVVNGTAISTQTTDGSSSGTSYTWSNINITVISSIVINQTTTGKRITIDDISWTSYSIPSNSTDYFRSYITGNWNTASVWQSSADNSTWSIATLTPTSSAASITIQSGHTVTIATDVTASTLVIAGTGTLTFDGVAAHDISVTGNVTISAAGGSFITQSSGAFTNTMSIGGDLTNEGTFDMSRGGTTLVCNVTFNKNGNQTVSGAGTTTRFNMVTVDMGTSYSNILEISSSNFQTATNFLHSSAGAVNQLKNGTIKFSGSYTYSNTLFQVGTYYNIVATAGIWLNNSNVTTTAVGDSYDLRGLLRVTAGTFNVGTTSGNSIKYFSNSVFTMEGGTVNVAGRFYCNSIGQTVACTITGGTMTLCTQGSNTASSKFASFQITAASTFVWSGGTIILQQGQNYYGGMDYSDACTTATITGGTLQICNSSSGGGISEFYYYSVNSIGNLTLTTTNSPVLFLFSDLDVIGNISVATGTEIDAQADPNAYAYEVSNPGTTVYSATASYDVYLQGNWINNGTFTNRSKTVTFNGSTSQDISGSTETNYYNMTVNNSSGVTITQGPLISNVLTFTSGNITASSSSEPIIIETTGSVSGQADTKCVVGYCQKNTNSTAKFTFPVGSSSKYRPMSVTPAGAGATSWKAMYFDAAYSDLSVTDIDHVSQLEYWTLDRSGASPQNSTIELSWNSSSQVDADYSDLVVAHYNGSDWHTAGGNNITGNTTAGTVESNSGWSSYSPFTLGSNVGIVPLPIELIEFSAKSNIDNVFLNWQTASEINNDYFVIERSFDGVHFSPIYRKEGAGNSSHLINYDAKDIDYIKGINYYRLKQVDFNGEESNSKILAVDMTKRNGTIVRVINTLGQEVNENYTGIVFDIYSDGTSVRRIQ